MSISIFFQSKIDSFFHFLELSIGPKGLPFERTGDAEKKSLVHPVAVRTADGLPSLHLLRDGEIHIERLRIRLFNLHLSFAQEHVIILPATMVAADIVGFA